MEQAIDDQRRATTRDEQISADMRFHEVLAWASGNSLFPAVLLSVNDLRWESRRKCFSNAGISHAVENHQAVLEAIKRHDGPAARQHMLHHMQMTEQDLNGEDR